MSNVPEEWQFLTAAWRYALLLTGCREGAGKVFKEVAAEISMHPHPGDLNRTRHLFFTTVRRRSLKFMARNELSGIPGKLHALAEPSRSALALLYLDALPVSGIGRILDLDPRSLTEVLDKGRAELGTEVTP